MKHRPIESKEGLAMVERFGAYCMSLPGTEEEIDGFGHTSFRVKDKPYVRLGEGGGRGPGMTIRTLPETQEVLLRQPYYEKPMYIGRHGWVSLRASDPVPWEEIQGLVWEAYCRTAPKRLWKERH
ncbi:MmcQ/YjbR family DNA-binding protein [Paenibacillus humicola]|uniref:MmcQ/YjbR family DNA-binding protein n=1 Tax=Paenibacillus humicola TaxID=3110540 RepID=UPI00237BB39D|nr:MmcQ/YjbR family DNA-binding protein [Paenibacillus humicola]